MTLIRVSETDVTVGLQDFITENININTNITTLLAADEEHDALASTFFGGHQEVHTCQQWPPH
jgi:hypothetical protein